MSKTITFEQITTMCRKLSNLVKETGINVTGIIVPARGGMVPGVIVSSLLGDIPVISVYHTPEKGKGNSRHQINTVPETYNWINTTYPTGSTFLILDDIADTGLTLRDLKSFASHDDFEVITSSLFVRHDSKYIPDLHIEVIDDDTFVDFPWEVK